MPRFKVVTRVSGTNEYVIEGPTKEDAEGRFLDLLADDAIVTRGEERDEEYIIDMTEIE